MAHVFAAGDEGPRANALLSEKERGAFENLILLCALCHTIVDKAPERFGDQVILEWKRRHAQKLSALFGVKRYERRSDALAAIEGPLRENHHIFERYGPHIQEARNPESGAAERWERKVLQRIIPNNRKVLAQLDANTHLLTGEEPETLESFRQHVDDLEARHIQGYQEGASRFPANMPKMLRD